MGRSAKFAKRPTKAEKVARQINKPINSHNRERSLSPETNERSEIPLFNTSAKGRQVSNKPDPRKVPLEAMEDDNEEEPADLVEALEEEAAGSGGGKKPSTLKSKLKKATQQLKQDGEKTERKLGAKYGKGGKKAPILEGKDYVKMLESRPGGQFKHKKLR
ncbi:uncharacterized protein JCM6883_005586 [Sporobolomyces salmoneus]|uniref:uncharacterized protein n=1 Tax=Sporobolomyces salmoneus TaxID=183962 RepID=UPI00317DADAE